ncbi:unnamed protein product [Urochloa decumbens]|uniref:F-box domain-containing protein n=1 Tax=Urochloa decumbens TaxID=240449 RepID=A0ABC9FK57_9POAL
MDHLPEELLADILRRVPPRPLAVCRSVSKDLCATIDGRGLLLAISHRVPRGLRGVFINFHGQNRPYFFSRRECLKPRVDGELGFLPKIGWREAAHHSNGLLLVRDWGELYVCNPATRRWAHLPPQPRGFGDAEHLVFDPTVSLHYEVISFDKAPRKPKIPIQPGIKRPSWCQSFGVYTDEEIQNLPFALRAKYDHEAQIQGAVEWPPSSYMAQVFSSRTGQWDERVYVREDDVVVTLMDVWSDPWGPDSYEETRYNSVYWQGAFYIHCRGGFVMRLSLLEQKYKVIKTPRLDNVFMQPRLDEETRYAYWKIGGWDGKSEDGIYYTALCWYQLRVWVLHEASESSPMPQWELKHKADIKPSFRQYYLREDKKEDEKSWSLDPGTEGSDDRVDCGWDSSDDGITNVKAEDAVDYDDNRYCNMRDGMDFLGYHPSKEIALLGNGFDGFAYYLNTSRLQYLGRFYPTGCTHIQVAATHESFIYTPCMEDLLPNHERNTTHVLDDSDDDYYFGTEDGDSEEMDADVDDDLEDELYTDKDENLEEVEDEDGLLCWLFVDESPECAPTDKQN